MTQSPVLDDSARDALQHRTLNVLRAGVVPGQMAIAGVVAVASLLGNDLLGNDRLAGLGNASFTLGSAIVSVPLAAAMRRRGRRPGLVAALMLGLLGSVIAAAGGQARWFWLFVVGMLVLGCGQAATYQARYAAADLAAESERARAIGAIVWFGTIGAVFGPIVTPLEKRVGVAIGFDEFIGPYLFSGVLFGVAGLVWWRKLRPDPLVAIGATDPDAERARPLHQLAITFGVIRQSPGALLGIVAMAAAQSAMVGVMTMTPPHMKGHDHADLSQYVLSLHILGMFGFAPLVARVVQRLGAVRAIQLGGGVLGAGCLVAIAIDYEPAMIFAGLFLLGVGWSLGLIGGSTLLTASVAPEVRVEAQGAADLMLSACGAVAALGSGFVKQDASYGVLAVLATILAGTLALFAAMTRWRLGRLGVVAAA